MLIWLALQALTGLVAGGALRVWGLGLVVLIDAAACLVLGPDAWLLRLAYAGSGLLVLQAGYVAGGLARAQVTSEGLTPGWPGPLAR